MANGNDDEKELRAQDIRLKRMRWIMDRFEAVGLKRRNVFSVDEAIEWWQAYKPRTVPAPAEEKQE